MQSAVVMRLIVAALLCCSLGCDDSCYSEERELATSGAIRHARFVEKTWSLEVASSSTGELVRSSCGRDLRRYDARLAPEGTIDVEYDLPDEQWITSVAIDATGEIAAVTYELEYIGDIDERTFTRLMLFEANGRRRWSTVLARDEFSAAYDVAIGAGEIYVTRDDGRIAAYSRASGAQLWDENLDSLPRAAIAADPAGGVTVADHDRLESYDAAGSLRWSVSAQTLGLGELDRVAHASDGSIAVLGNDGVSADRTQRIAMVEPAGALRWSHAFGKSHRERVTSIATDGTRIIAAGDYGGMLGFDPRAPVATDADGFLTTIGAAGLESTLIAGGAGSQHLYVSALTADSVIAHATTFEDPSSPQLVIGDLTVDGIGTAILHIAR